jgi:tRNA pseudouridine55 synthase
MRHGFLLVDKPIGMTSHDVVSRVRKQLPERSVGHLGTLDPAATGLLVLAVGKKALKVVQLFAGMTKEYVAEVRFGAVSSTYDRDGVVEERPLKPGWAPPEHAVLQRTIDDRFLGRIQQVPPAHSAVHVGGERAYRKARQGRHVELAAREVEVQSCEIVSYEFPMATLRIACGSGTYIRSLAHDLGEVLRCGAYLAGLRRTKVGEWSIDDAVSLDDVSWSRVLPLKEVLKDQPGIELTNDEYEDIRMGQNIFRAVLPNTIGWFEELPVAIFVSAGEGEAHAKKVF